MNRLQESRIKISLILLLGVLCATFASATPLCNNNFTSALSIENYRPYNDIGQYTFYAHYTDAAGNPLTGNNTLVWLVLGNTTSNMTNLTSRWSVTIATNISEDVPISIYAQNDYFSCKAVNITTKFRTPFYVSFLLYKEPLNSSDPAPYINQFQYVVMTDDNNVRTLDMSLAAWSNGINGASSAVSEAVLGASFNTPAKPDGNVYFWGAYNNGVATIKLYEPSNYSVYVMNNKVSYGVNTFTEFEKPLRGEAGYMGNVLKHLALYNATNLSMTPYGFNNSIVSVSLSRFEANSYFATINLFYVLMVIIAFIGGLVLVIAVCGNMNGGFQIIAAYVLGGGSLALGIIFSVIH